MTSENATVREQLQNLALTDALNSRRMADSLREGFTAALLKKADSMDPDAILAAIEKMESISKLAPYQEILDLLSK